MNTNVIPFDSNKGLPAHLKNASAGMSLNAAAEEFASVRFPVISTEGKVFHVKRDGEKELIKRVKANPGDPDEPASFIEVVILNLQKSKTYYAGTYEKGSTDKPTCYSNNGVTPDISAEEPQSAKCALCPKNVWGSGRDAKGNATKGKACADVQRVAVAPVGALDDPMLFRVPPTSLKILAEMSKMLSRKNIPLNGVITRIAFDTDATGVLTFKPVGFLDAETFKAAEAKENDDLVLTIIGKRGSETAVPAGKALMATPEVDPEAEAKKAKAEAKAEAKAKKVAAAKAAAEAAAKAAAEAEADDDDDEPVTKSKASVATSSNLDEELAALLG